MLYWVSVLGLAGHWLFGNEILHEPRTGISLVFLVAGVSGHWGVTLGPVARPRASVLAVLLLGALPIAPAGLRAVIVLLCLGLSITALSRHPVSRKASDMFLASGWVLALQALAVYSYQHLTAVYQHVPGLWTRLNALLLSLAGYSVGVGNDETSLFVMRKVLTLSSGWGYFFGPCAAAFFAGCVARLWLDAATGGLWTQRYRLAKGVGWVASVAAVWSLVKALALTAIFTFDAWLTGYDDPLVLMHWFYSNWVRVMALFPAALMVGAVLRRATPDAATTRGKTAGGKHVRWPLWGIGASVGALAFALHFDRVGIPKDGLRVWVDEHHGEWESTEHEYGTEVYGERSGYNYYVMYDYLSHFFDMDRVREEITSEKLRDCDVLVLKVPTQPYSEQEQLAIVRFVESGGGLLLLGEHTDVFRSSSYLNEISRRFGFEFLNDALLHIDNVFEQRVSRPYPAHPVLNFVDELDLAVSGSIDTDNLLDRSVIVGTALRGLRADYHMANFYPVVTDHTDVDYGPFVQLLAKRYGKGRVIAFADSTIFSNFCIFEEGKSELMVGMLTWLNAQGNSTLARLGLSLLGLVLLVWASFELGGVWRQPQVVLSIALVGCSLGVWLVNTYHESAMPWPQRTTDFVDVSIDRSLSSVPLSRGGFLSGDVDGYGIFEQWLLRLGYFTHRRGSDTIFRGDWVVFFNPNQPVDSSFADRAAAYVNGGGKILVVDSDVNDRSTANDLLVPFGLRVVRPGTVGGPTASPVASWPVSPMRASLVVEGPETLLRCGNQAVLARASIGAGEVYVAGFGADFADANMGVSIDVEPDETLRQRFELLFAISRFIVGHTREEPSGRDGPAQQ